MGIHCFLCWILISCVMFSCGSKQESIAAEELSPEILTDTSYYHGRIDKYPIVIQLIQSGKKLNGHYYYMNSDGLIKISGNQNEKIELDEKSGNKITGHFSLTIKDKRIEGTWKNNRKNFKVNLEKFEIKKNLPITWKKKIFLEYFSTTEIYLKDQKVLTVNDIDEDSVKGIIKARAEDFHGDSGCSDTVLWSKHGVINLEHFSSYVGNTEYYAYRYSLFDGYTLKYLTPKEIYNDPEKMKNAAIKKLNEIVDGEIKANQKSEEWDGNEYPVVSMEYNRNKFGENDLTNFYIKEEGIHFFHDFFYNRLEEPFSPYDYILFSYKEIRPFIKPDGPLNFLLTDPFLKK